MTQQHASPTKDQQEALQKLGEIRGSIDNLDAAMIHILAERFRHTQEVGELKAKHDLPPSDPEREKRQVARLRELAHESRLDPEFAEKFLNFVIAEVIHHHRRIAEGAAATTEPSGE
ncbi:chorismate mutase [Gulosibacter molinativorax]|uniref:Chorismate mutase n=1 Tax=Gulosibacter molinativorax TaxID=256821 RepID=A0ABT7C7P9_9MICO|nr:chorismate mutase [Gulosibacter molinativorax]MDJ1371182.1 chorismate mutase [Gulosibacter molinativorax]QUY62997.1 Chorismate mutase [Gulosibacter molinativorax]